MNYCSAYSFTDVQSTGTEQQVWRGFNLVGQLSAEAEDAAGQKELTAHKNSAVSWLKV